MTDLEHDSVPFSPQELAYLADQILGRLATQKPDGTLQNNPVGFRYNPATATVDISGHSLETTRKFRNVQHNGRAALVVDDLVSVQPWRSGVSRSAATPRPSRPPRIPPR